MNSAVDLLFYSEFDCLLFCWETVTARVEDVSIRRPVRGQVIFVRLVFTFTSQTSGTKPSQLLRPSSKGLTLNGWWLKYILFLRSRNIPSLNFTRLVYETRQGTQRKNDTILSLRWVGELWMILRTGACYLCNSSSPLPSPVPVCVTTSSGGPRPSPWRYALLGFSREKPGGRTITLSNCDRAH
jgi:hypothetical protein